MGRENTYIETIACLPQNDAVHNNMSRHKLSRPKGIMLFFISLFAPCTLLMAQTYRYQTPIFDRVLITEGIPFSIAEKVGTDDFTTLYLDFYEPAGDTAQLRPLVITVFGGAFVAGSRDFSDMEEYCKRLAKHGYVAASIDYRLMSVFSASATNIIRQIFIAAQDVSSAIRYFKLYGEDYKIDTNNIFLLGNSAGTIAILHEMFMEEQERPEETLSPPALNSLHSSGYAEYQDKSTKIAGAVAQWGGVLDLDMIDSVECVPLCLIHGTEDESVPYDSGYCYSSSFSFLMPYIYGSHSISERFSEIGFDDYEFHPFQGEEHAFYLSSFYQLIDEKFDTCFNITRDFLLRHLDFSEPIDTSSMYHDTTEIYDQDVPTPIFEIFPNPTKGIINLKCNSLNYQSVSVRLFDMHGNLLESERMDETNVRLDLSEYKMGIYFLEIFEKGMKIAVYKLVKLD